MKLEVEKYIKVLELLIENPYENDEIEQAETYDCALSNFKLIFKGHISK